MALWVVILVMIILLATMLRQGQQAVPPLAYSDFLAMVDQDKVESVVIEENLITGKDKDGKEFNTYAPGIYEGLITQLRDKVKTVDARPKPEAGFWRQILIMWFPLLLIVGLWIFFIRQMQAGGGKAMSFGKSRARLLTENQHRVTFEDVAGVEESKVELEEIIEFLREPKKFTRLGGRIPKGVLLIGTPGTGKTLLARAVAGEAGVPFFSISGSDFVEMFVGVGASRVRDLFLQGKKNAPCIIFIDEIDAVGRHRGAGLGGGHDEREQTLNALLVEMDGFESNDGVILIAATNRPDVLDPALLRPGRFDRRVVVSRPDVRGREGILQVHTRKIPLAEDVDLSVLARATPGFSGADLANLVNEAALAAARQSQKFVSMKDFEASKDKVLMGAERKSMIITDEEKKVTAYHEAGHALLAALVPHSDPLHKVTIIPRGLALGLTQQLPSEERHNWSKDQLEARIAVCMGGRIAEETTFSQITTGAQNDIEQATEMARKMVCEWGMSEALGPLTYGKKEEAIFLGKEFNRHQDYSEATALKIDSEIKRIVTEQYERAAKLLTEKRPLLVRIAEALLEHEVLDAPQLKQLIAGEPVTVKVPTPPVPAPSREPRAPEESRPAGILPPPVPDPRPTS
jgi:cell division protease FtsH